MLHVYMYLEPMQTLTCLSNYTLHVQTDANKWQINQNKKEERWYIICTHMYVSSLFFALF